MEESYAEEVAIKMSKSTNQMRVDEKFDRIIKEIATLRVKRDKDSRTKSSQRLTRAMARHPRMPEIARDIIEADLEEERR